MRIYAVMSDNPRDWTALIDADYPHVLVSYLFDAGSARHREREFTTLTGYTPALFLDSGAYSVWSQGKTVDLEGYAGWALDVVASRQDVVVANLDVIPGQPGSPPTTSERLESARRGMENADYLRSRGLPVAEAYHRYEPLTVLDRLAERRQPGEVLAIGGLVGGTDRRAKHAECVTIFARLRDLHGGWDRLPPVHGFGIGADSALGQRLPWWSIDSISWIATRQFGLATGRGGKTTAPTGRRTAKPEASVNFIRTLNRWQRVAQSLTRAWEERGVRFDIERAAA